MIKSRLFRICHKVTTEVFLNPNKARLFEGSFFMRKKMKKILTSSVVS